MLGRGILWQGVDERLELVELVHADDAPVVLARRARLLAVAGRPAGVLERSVRQVEDLVGVVAGERHLADVPVRYRSSPCDPVHLIGVLAEEARAAHDLGTHERRRDERNEAGLDGAVQRHVHEPELEARPHTPQEVEPTARDLDPALDVDRAEQLAEVGVVARLEVEARRARRRS